jgi:hypothetical protein
VAVFCRQVQRCALVLIHGCLYIYIIGSDTCMFIHIYIYIYIYIYMWACIYIHTYIIHIHIPWHTYVYTYRHTFIHFIHTQIHTCNTYCIHNIYLSAECSGLSLSWYIYIHI